MGRSTTTQKRNSKKPQGARLHPSHPAGNTLPAASTRCIGRERELADILAYFATDPGMPPRRLLTLIGAGGVGNTRLALEAGWELQSSCADGAWLIELAALEDSSQIARAIASTLGLPMPGSGNAEDELIARLENQAALLIIDNCEHVLAACSRLIGHILADCPHIRVLATSQAMLRVSGETALKVTSLAVPDKDAAIDARRVLRYHVVFWELDLEPFKAVLASIEAVLSITKAESAWTEGESMTLDQAINYAVNYAEELLR